MSDIFQLGTPEQSNREVIKVDHFKPIIVMKG
jgi:hypothetical protein